MDIERFASDIIEETEKVIVGKHDKIEMIVMAILSGGHVLIEDLPGVGKTTLAKTLSLVLGCQFGRIQFVSDLLPSDIIGMQIFNQKTGDFELRRGPVMVNMLLADEINRAIPRTQSALLEAMEEKQVTIDGVTMKLPSPFFVIATENPVERESTFNLPVAQMDRFLISLSIGYPDFEHEMEMLERVGTDIPFESLDTVASVERVLEAQRVCRGIFVSDAVREYIVRIIDATRHDPRIKLGASPRASKALFQAGKTWAAMHGRDYVTPDDIVSISDAVLRHRIVLESSIGFSGIDSSSIIKEIISQIDASPSADRLANEIKTLNR